MVKSKDVELRHYFSFRCRICRGKMGSLIQDSYRSWCYVCDSCDRMEMIKQTLTREYARELKAVNSNYRKKFLDMMVRDTVRAWKRCEKEKYFYVVETKLDFDD